MNDEIKTCIYCRSQDQAWFKGVEHVIPQAFGLYGTATPTLNCVCDDCNKYFGDTHDLYLARETLEGVLRYRKGLYSSEARPQKNLNITLEQGPETGQFAGMKVAIDGTTGQLMAPSAQFQIFNQKTGITEVYFKKTIPGLRLAEEEYGRAGTDTEKASWKCAIYSQSQADHDDLVEVLRSNGIAFKSGEPFQLPMPVVSGESVDATFPVCIEGVVGPEHKRAHAKILLNVIAHHLGCSEALQPHWDFLRRYARYEEGLIRARLSNQPFFPGQETNILRLVGDSINVRIENMHGHVVGAIEFYGQDAYEYILRENDAVPPEHEFGYRFTAGLAPIPAVKFRLVNA